METCDLCGEEMDDWMCCPVCGAIICWDCVDRGSRCVCGHDLDPDVED